MNKHIQKLILLLMLGLPLISTAHNPNQSYIFLRIYEKDGIEGRFEINTREINKVFGWGWKRNVSMQEISEHIEELRTYLLNNTSFSSTYGAHAITLLPEYSILPVTQGSMIQIPFRLQNMEPQPKELTIGYKAVFEKDDTHRAFVITEYNWGAGVINEEANISLSFSPTETQDVLNITESSIWKGFVAMVKQGVWHIWIGLDHILFLLALILPSVVLRFRNSQKEIEAPVRYGITWDWIPVKRFRPAFLYIVKIITFFTIAHTITLTLATLELVVLPSRFVESIIAFSIGLAALHNIKPIFKGKDWMIAFIFGLFHGFGFASVLGDLGLTGEFLSLSLLGFNVGVELGQLVIIALIFPILFFIRNLKSYPKFLVIVSIMLILVSLYWCIERIFEVNLGLEEALKRFIYKALVAIGLK